jgi:hypothetical protein
MPFLHQLTAILSFTLRTHRLNKLSVSYLQAHSTLAIVAQQRVASQVSSFQDLKRTPSSYLLLVLCLLPHRAFLNLQLDYFTNLLFHAFPPKEAQVLHC